MIKKVLPFLLVALVFVAFAGFALAAADPIISLPNPLCPGGAGSANCIDSFRTLITQITSYIFTIVGLLAVLMFIWAGILFLTSAGSPEKIAKAKEALKWAVIGVAIAAAGTGLVAVIKAVIGNGPT